MEIKICGITRKKEIEYLVEAGVDYAGFVFFEKSKRNVSYEDATKLIALLPDSIRKVAVTVSPDEQSVRTLCGLGFDILQVHKELSPEAAAASTIPIWYAVNISDEEELEHKLSIIHELGELESRISAVVVDSANFGSGQVFNWRKSRRLLKAGAQSPPDENVTSAESDAGKANVSAADVGKAALGEAALGEEPTDSGKTDFSKIFAGRQFVLAGGLSSENVREGISFFNPDVVDVSSGVEGECGKDRDKILAFVKAARAQ